MNKMTDRTSSLKDIFRCHLIRSFSNLVNPAILSKVRTGSSSDLAQASAKALDGPKSLDRISRMNKMTDRTSSSKDIFRCHLIRSFSNLVNPEILSKVRTGSSSDRVMRMMSDD
jgi:hypothetical protein